MTAADPQQGETPRTDKVRDKWLRECHDKMNDIPQPLRTTIAATFWMMAETSAANERSLMEAQRERDEANDHPWRGALEGTVTKMGHCIEKLERELAASRSAALEEVYAALSIHSNGPAMLDALLALKENAAPQRDVVSVPRAAVPRETLVQAHQLALSLSGILAYAKSCDAAAPTERTPK